MEFPEDGEVFGAEAAKLAQDGVGGGGEFVGLEPDEFPEERGAACALGVFCDLGVELSEGGPVAAAAEDHLELVEGFGVVNVERQRASKSLDGGVYPGFVLDAEAAYGDQAFDLEGFGGGAFGGDEFAFDEGFESAVGKEYAA